MPRGRWFALAVFAVTAGACSSEEGSGVPAGVSTTGVESEISEPTTSSTTSVAPSTTTAPTTAAPTTAAPTTAAATSAPPTTEVDDGLVLSGTGIGEVPFGSEPDEVIAYLGAELGSSPTQDTGWVDPFQVGPCPGTELRLVSWGGLTAQFGDESPVATGRRHFVAYVYGLDGELGVPPVGLETDRGITPGSTVAELTAAYPDAILNPEDEFGAANYFVDETLRGLLTGVGGDDVVTVITGGSTCFG